MTAPEDGAPLDSLPAGRRVFEAAFELGLHAVWILSPDGAVLAANRRARAVMSGAAGWRGGQAVVTCFPRATVASRAALALFLEGISTASLASIQVEDTDASGSHRVHEVTMRAVPASDSEPLFCILEARDVTEIRRMNAAAVSARLAAEAADRAKASFLARMSHEMRTPLHAVLGFARLLRERVESSDGEAMEAAEQIEAAGGRLLALVNDVLELARLESGGLTADTAPTEPVRLLRGLAESFAAAAARRGLDFELEIDPRLPAWVVLDAARLRRALGDLLDNAVRYTETGGIRLASTWEPEGRREWTLLQIRDTGPGISQEVRARVLSPFESGSRGRSGTGLGLALARRLVLLMGGEFLLESDERGTVISIELPTPLIEQGPATPDVPELPAAGGPFQEPRKVDLSWLPASLRDELSEAALLADFARLRQRIDTLRVGEPEAAEALSELLDRFDYRALREALTAQPAAASAAGSDERQSSGGSSGSPTDMPESSEAARGREKK